MTDKKNIIEEDKMNRRSLITLASVLSIAVWHKPVINSIILPAHAQTSCNAIDDVNIVGNWRFTDQNNVTVDIEIIDDNNVNFDNRGVNEPLIRASNGTLIFDIRRPRAGWQGTITEETNCVASEITITIAPTDANTYTAPLIGVKI